MPHSVYVEDARFERPMPRRPCSPGRAARIRVQNRRREYLVRHTSYFDNQEHEFSDPTLYERLVKKFQTPAERDAESKLKGYGHILEADLRRGEAKLADLAESNGNGSSAEDSPKPETGLELTWESPATDKAQGMEFWHEFLQERFVKGQDEDFDYGSVDENEDLDSLLREDAEEAWFDQEEPSWVAETGAGENENAITELEVQGETGVQDF
ncbi:hypothetical protein G7046_g5631 [Stylonectria norvegica]|nr:hypothetical protein G7046_g5631 [Stylonectria norvegica]